PLLWLLFSFGSLSFSLSLSLISLLPLNSSAGWSVHLFTSIFISFFCTFCVLLTPVCVCVSVLSPVVFFFALWCVWCVCVCLCVCLCVCELILCKPPPPTHTHTYRLA